MINTNNIIFGRDPESGQVVSYKYGKQIGTITTMGDLVTKENMEKREDEIKNASKNKKKEDIQ